MKNIMLFAAMAALLTVASCQKEDASFQNSAKDPVFTATIENSVTKTSVDAANNKVDWVMNDEITVTDNSSVSVKYTVTAIDGSGKATFTKKSGETGTLGSGPYSAVYGSAPSTSQTYSASAPSLPMTGVSGESDTKLKFTVSCGLLEITLTQTGESIKSISVSDNASTPNTYTLNCGDGVSIKDGEKFYIAVPEGVYTSFIFTNTADVESPRTGLNISVSANHTKPVSSSFSPIYREGSYSGLAIYVADKWWAPVNCGYDATNYPNGSLYQWGRKYGQPYELGNITPTQNMLKTDDTEANKDKHGWADDGNYDNNWFCGPIDKTLWSSTKTDHDPCPAGWRVPTISELEALISNRSQWISKDGQNGRYFSGSTAYSEAVPSVFLPAAGQRDRAYGEVYNNQIQGNYWTSTNSGVSDEWFNFIYFNQHHVISAYLECSNGYSVRCVQI